MSFVLLMSNQNYLFKKRMMLDYQQLNFGIPLFPTLFKRLNKVGDEIEVSDEIVAKCAIEDVDEAKTNPGKRHGFFSQHIYPQVSRLVISAGQQVKGTE